MCPHKGLYVHVQGNFVDSANNPELETVQCIALMSG